MRNRSREGWDATRKPAQEETTRIIKAASASVCWVRSRTRERREEDEEDAELARAARAEGDASCTLADDDGQNRPGEVPRRRPPPPPRRGALLDVIVGSRLPSESLVAAVGGGGGGGKAAYFANVCVAPAARQRGIGAALLSEAISLVASGVIFSSPAPSRIAVHAEARNAAARALYEHSSLGFELEAEESLEVESRKGRPRRVLYSRPVPMLPL